MRLLSICVTACLTLLGFGQTSSAQEAPTWAPAELYGCKFVGSAGMDDLNRVIAAWNRWMDQNGNGDYAAFVLTPHFTAASFEYNVVWLGVWRNGQALGGEQQWLTQGAAINEDFGEVVDCSMHQAVAMTQVRNIGEVAEGDIVPVEISNCTIKENHVGPEALSAVRAAAGYMAENGSQAGHWLLRPGPGAEPDATYSFKWLTAYPSWTALGNDFELYFNRGGGARANDLTSRIFACDHARLYNTRNVRRMANE